MAFYYYVTAFGNRGALLDPQNQKNVLTLGEFPDPNTAKKYIEAGFREVWADQKGGLGHPSANFLLLSRAQEGYKPVGKPFTVLRPKGEFLPKK